MQLGIELSEDICYRLNQGFAWASTIYMMMVSDVIVLAWLIYTPTFFVHILFIHAAGHGTPRERRQDAGSE